MEALKSNKIEMKVWEREKKKTDWGKKGAYVIINTWYSVGGNPTSSGRCKEDYGFGRFWKH